MSLFFYSSGIFFNGAFCRFLEHVYDFNYLEDKENDRQISICLRTGFLSSKTGKERERERERVCMYVRVYVCVYVPWRLCGTRRAREGERAEMERRVCVCVCESVIEREREQEITKVAKK